MIRAKSADRALREQSSVPSGRWKTGWRNFTSSVVMPTNTSRPRVRDEAEGRRHRRAAAGRVDDHVGQVAVGQVAQLGLGLVGRLDRVLHAHDLAAERQPLLVDILHDDLRAGQLGEFQRRQADRAGPDDEARLFGVDGGALDGVAADGQRLDEGELLEGELARDVELAGGDEEARPQAAVAVDAERLVLLAAVGVAAPAGVALLAVDVRLDASSGRPARTLVTPSPTARTSTPSSWPGMRG